MIKRWLECLFVYSLCVRVDFFFYTLQMEKSCSGATGLSPHPPSLLRTGRETSPADEKRGKRVRWEVEWVGGWRGSQQDRKNKKKRGEEEEESGETAETGRDWRGERGNKGVNSRRRGDWERWGEGETGRKRRKTGKQWRRQAGNRKKGSERLLKRWTKCG